ncbi:MAG: hypothetical protein ACYTGR_12905 [Planctomycetota bacterium]|jgi:hypothetical protein
MMEPASTAAAPIAEIVEANPGVRPARTVARAMTSVVAWGLLCASICFWPAGCAAPQPTDETDPYSVAPGDFALEVIVLRHPDDIRAYRRALAADQVDDWPPAHERPSRYVLLSDGALYHEIDRQISMSRRPPLTRFIDRRDVAEVWSRCRSLGFADPRDADPRGNLALVSPDPGQVSYLIEVTGDDERWDFIRTVDPAAEDPAIAELVRHLAALVWARDDAGERRVVVPRRYDFGPDPYAMYR